MKDQVGGRHKVRYRYNLTFVIVYHFRILYISRTSWVLTVLIKKVYIQWYDRKSFLYRFIFTLTKKEYKVTQDSILFVSWNFTWISRWRKRKKISETKYIWTNSLHIKKSCIFKFIILWFSIQILNLFLVRYSHKKGKWTTTQKQSNSAVFCNTNNLKVCNVKPHPAFLSMVYTRK